MTRSSHAQHSYYGTVMIQTGGLLRVAGRLWMRDNEYTANATLAYYAQHHVYRGTGGHTLWLPEILNADANNQTLWVYNQGTGDVNVVPWPTTADTMMLNGVSVTTAVLSPGEAMMIHQREDDDSSWVAAYFGGPKPSTQSGGGGGSSQPWEGLLVATFGDGNPMAPDVLWNFQNTAVSVAAPTQTGIGVSIGRLQNFTLKTAITVNRLRYFGLAAVAAGYTFAVYRADTGARLMMLDPLPVVSGWNSQSIAAAALPAGVPLWVGIGAKATGTVAAFRSPVSPIANSIGLAAMPGNMATYGPRYAQVALTNGAWPATLPALANAAFASAAATGTLPLFFLDNNSAA